MEGTTVAVRLTVPVSLNMRKRAVFCKGEVRLKWHLKCDISTTSHKLNGQLRLRTSNTATTTETCRENLQLPAKILVLLSKNPD